MSTISFISFFDAVTFEHLYGWVQFGLSAVVILGLLIVVHEYGHFISARLVGVRVEKFSIGFGPKLVSKKAGDTEYLISAIPLGGFVKFYGDAAEEVDNEEDAFLNQPVWKRLIIVSAGPIFNIVLAVALVTAAALYGLPEGSRIIDQVIDDTPAQSSGLLEGDRIDAIGGVRIETWRQVQDTIRKSPGDKLDFDIARGSERLTIQITPAEYTAKGIDGKDMTIGRIGVIPRQVVKSYPLHQAAFKGVEWTWGVVKLTVWAISKLVTREIPADQIAGPVGIMQMAGQAAKTGLANLALFIAMISVNLGILNLLPIPVLDGGHLLFFSIEAVAGKPIKLKHQEIAQQIGVFMLISLMALAFYNDFTRIFSG